MKSRVADIRAMLNLVLMFPECIGWQELKDRGNPCVGDGDWYNLSSKELLDIGLTRTTIEYVMPKHSALFESAQKVIAHELSNKYVTYDWVCKSLARLFSGTNYDDFFELIQVAKMIKNSS